jgi:hypothetical protein
MKGLIMLMKSLNILMMSLVGANQNSVNTNEGLEYAYDDFG